MMPDICGVFYARLHEWLSDVCVSVFVFLCILCMVHLFFFITDAHAATGKRVNVCATFV